MILTELAKELLFPRKCILCGKVLTMKETDLCHGCRSDEPEYEAENRTIPDIVAVTAVWYYEGAVRDSLLRFKFHHKPGYAEGYGRMLAMRVVREIHGIDLITWVPVSARRKRERGYDQSELLARTVSRELGIGTEPMLRKHRHNRAQSGISDAAQRRENVRGVYHVTDERLVKGKRILLLDDIVTTGATAGECARMLLDAGARSVALATVAAGREKNLK